MLRQKKWADAEAMLRECLAIRAKKEPDAWTTSSANSMLGEALAGQAKYADAEPLLLAGYEGLKARDKNLPPAAKQNLPESLQRLIDLYTAWGNPDAAAKWRAELPTPSGAKP